MTDSTIPDTPAWVKDAVFYQIFPDRFAKSERLAHQKPGNLLPWSDPPHPQKYHGGDLLGVAEKLDYLRDLGINALYLNPIFQSACNHRYHTHDYYQVDPLLGGNPALRELIDEAHQRGMRVVLDGVFNHASRGFFQFNDILENGPHSPWLDWFYIQGWPLSAYDGRYPANYVGWWDMRELPKFNTDNPEVQEFLMQVAEFWLREYDIDGWRLDVPAEITTPGFWEAFRQRVRAIKPDAYIVGEIWEVAPEWLSGSRFDANMNYPFTTAVGAFVGQEISRALTENRSYNPYPGIDASRFEQQIDGLLNAYHWQTTQVMLNLLDSHDTPRFLSVMKGDKSALKLATLFQMCFPGAPCVYYGNEIALRGTDGYEEQHHDKDARWPFPWHDESVWDREMLAYFKQVIQLRHEQPLLRHGRYTALYASDGTYAFARHDKSGVMIIALNTDAAEQPATILLGDLLPDGRVLDDLLGQIAPTVVLNGQLKLSVPGRSGVVLG